MEKTEMNIYQKLSAIANELPKVAKNLYVDLGKGSYKAVSEVDIINAVLPLEEKYGVYSYPVRRRVTETDVLTTEKEYKGNVTRGNQLFMRLEVAYRFVNLDNPKEFVDMISFGDGVDSQDKAPGKAMTYADKYALMKAYKIRTGEDPDQEGSAKLIDSERKGKLLSAKQLAMLQDWQSKADDPNYILETLGFDSLEEVTMEKASEFISDTLAQMKDKKR